MNCPDCGAAMEPVANRNVFHCSHCNNFEFPEDSGEGVRVLGDLVDFNCPVCQKPLQAAIIEGESINYCPRCRGFLTPLRTFGAIVTKRRALHGAHEEQFYLIDREELKRIVHCPACHHRMDTHPYFGGGAAVVDTCENCGLIWLDAGELAIIERHVPHEVPHLPSPDPAALRAEGDDFPSLF
jgi:Zn-finger nucleic acid-binding protein